MRSDLWHIGNTTVRTPYRLKEALTVLHNSAFAGNLVGRERENGFAELLHNKGIVRVDRLSGGERHDASDLGRKWRSALGQLSFIIMPAKKKFCVSRFAYPFWIDYNVNDRIERS